MNKVISRTVAEALSMELRTNGNCVVFTNGCFDILHAGHVRYLSSTKRLGDYLFLGLNTDSSVRRIKGDTRPINNECDRAEVLSALAAVDFVVLFDEPTASETIELLRPDVYVKGGDYAGQQFVERTLVEGYGGKVEFVDLVPGRSTTNTIKKMRE